MRTRENLGLVEKHQTMQPKTNKHQHHPASFHQFPDNPNLSEFEKG